MKTGRIEDWADMKIEQIENGADRRAMAAGIARSMPLRLADEIVTSKEGLPTRFFCVILESNNNIFNPAIMI